MNELCQRNKISFKLLCQLLDEHCCQTSARVPHRLVLLRAGKNPI